MIGSGGILYDSVLPGVITYISESGSYVASDGVIYLSDGDYQRFLSGEINEWDIYSWVDSVTHPTI